MKVAYDGVVEDFPITAEMTTWEVIDLAKQCFSITRDGWRLMHDDGRELETGSVLSQVADDEVVTLCPRVWR